MQITLPDGRVVELPDGMSREEMAAALNKLPPRIYEPSEVLPEAGKTAMKTIESIPKGINEAIANPGKTAAAVGEGTVGMIKSLLSGAGMPVTLPAYGILKGLEGWGEAVGANPMKGSAEAFKKATMDPALAMSQDLVDKYGGFLGGKEGWGFTPKEGVQNLGRTIAQKPFSVGMDVAPVVGVGAKGVGAAVRAATKVTPAADVATATTRLVELGLDHAKLSPSQIERLRTRGNELGWDKKTMEQEYRRTLFDEADVPPTTGMITGGHKDIVNEDNMRRGAKGSPPAEIMIEADANRIAALNKSAENIRSNLTGAPTPMGPLAVGETIAERTNVANSAAKKDVRAAYERAFDPAELKAAGIPEFVDPQLVRNLDNAVTNKFNTANFAATESAAPNTAQALKALREYAVTGKVPSIVPGEIPTPGGVPGSSWQSADSMRKFINDLRTSSHGNPTDLYGTRLVLDAFDETLGKGNELLNQARKAHSERVGTFEPGRGQAQGLSDFLKTVQNTENSGLTTFRKLFGSGTFKSGEAVVQVERLKKIFAKDPEGLAAVKEGALQHLFVDPKSYDLLSPQKTATQLKEALRGPRKEIYKALFTPEELARLARHEEVTRLVAKHTEPKNPSGTSYNTIADKRMDHWRVAGSVLGGALGHKMGLPSIVGETLGAATGAGLGPVLAKPSDWWNASKARGAVSPIPPEAPPGMSLAPWAAPGAVEAAIPDRRAQGGYLRTVKRR